MHLSDRQRARLLDIARRTIHHLLTCDGEQPAPNFSVDSWLDPKLQQPAGCFVSLHDVGSQRLRGCVGCLDAKLPLAQAVQQGAESVLHDPRFLTHPVRLDELSGLEMEITVLSPLVEADDCLDFDLLEHGIHLTIGEESGCFLPQVARETGWSREQLLERLCVEKLGLPHDAWKQSAAKLERFTTTIIGPQPFLSTSSPSTLGED
ncbi:MAG: AmmeMemoRadiSam system protein A [Anaerolineae bacterium]|nr:AmmeMemoRadiSam system protein A [Phycisphaerae bacterium]